MVLQFTRRKFLLLIFCGLFSTLLSSPLVAQSELGSKMDFIRETASTFEARWDRLSTPRKALSYTKRVIPFFSWIILCNATDANDSSFLMGECLSEERNAVFRLPMEQFRSRYRSVLENLWSLNELDAIKFSDAMMGQSTIDRIGNNIMPFLPIIAALILLLLIFKRYRAFALNFNANARGLTRMPPKIDPSNMKRGFFVCALIWLIGGALLQIVEIQRGHDIDLANFKSLYFFVFGSLTVILGAILVARWIWKKNNPLLTSVGEPSSPSKPVIRQTEKVKNRQSDEEHSDNRTERWDALTKYDDEISAAAEKLRPFGESWIEKLGQDFFALKEDRRYLANIVQTLLDDAKQREALRKEQEALSWRTRFRYTAEREICTEVSLKILREAEARGYTLRVEPNNSFSLTKSNSGQSFLYSNADIRSFGQILALSSKQGS